jgi:hypothetical protein
MIAKLESPLTRADEEFLARLTQAAYEATLRHRPQGPFVDVELDLWAALRGVVAEELSATAAD